MTKVRSNQKKKAYLILRIILALLVLLGIFVYLFKKAILLHPLSQSLIEGNLEIVVVVVGLTLVGLGGVFKLSALGKGQPKSLSYDIGLRMVATGYLVAFISALADYMGIGAHHELPYFGPLQSTGVFLGEAIIAIGFLLMVLTQRYE
jgi:protein-S-isoprenylcysteine O-methyltransferase Ste14